jgi:hypothetical protein
VLEGFNQEHHDLFIYILLLLDELMSGGWKPKISKPGGLPHITSEPRKLVDLGSQFRNGTECISGVLVYYDVVMCTEQKN